MNKTLLGHINNIKSCMNRGKFDPKKIKDRFAIEMSVTVVDLALNSGELTEKQFKDMVLGRRVKK